MPIDLSDNRLSPEEHLAKEKDSLRKKLASEHIKDFNESDINRWIVAHNTAEKALVGMKKCLHWRKENDVDHILTTKLPKETRAIIEREWNTGKCVVMSDETKDPCGRVIMVCRPVLHDKTVSSSEDMNLFMTWCLEYIVSQLELSSNGATDMCVICDLKDFTILNMDYGVARGGIKLMSNYFPERLGKLYIVNPPGFFTAIWVAIRGCLNKRTLEKTVITKIPVDVEKALITKKFDSDFPWSACTETPSGSVVSERSETETAANLENLK